MNLKKIITTSLLVSAMIPFAQGHAQGKNIPPDLFDDFGLTQTQNAKGRLPENAIAGKNRRVNVHTDLLSLETLTLNLYNNKVVTIVRDRMVDNGKGSKSWIGYVEGEDDSTVYLSSKGPVVFGVITIGANVYEIRYVGNKTHEINQIDLSKNPPDHPEGHGRHLENDLDSLSTISTIDSATSDLDLAGTIVDVMVVYTPKARTNAGGQSGIEAKIDNAVAMANQAYLNSNIDMQLNLVHTTEIAYTESGDIFKTHDDLTYKSDGKMDDIHSLRNLYGADAVVLIGTESSSCGISWTMTSPHSSFESRAFSVVKSSCISGHTFSHELGHLQGNKHNIENSSSAGAYDYSYGYRLCVSGGFRTVMSYDCGVPRVGYFSNPNIYYNSEITGTKTANTALSMNNTKSIVAAWRASTTVDTTVPNIPGNLLATALSDSEINLTWVDNANNETGFRLESSSNGGASWTEIATLGVNTTSFIDSGLASLTNYQYRVRAYNSNGNSQYSNMSSAATEQLLCVNNNPSLTMAPTTQYASAGELLTYNMSLKNNDSSVCNIVTFAITAQDGVTIGSYSLSPGGGANSTWNTSAPANDGTFTYSITASASAHNTVTANSTIIVDSTAPTKPGNMTVAVKRKTLVTVSWDTSADSVSGLKSYILQRNGITIADTSSTRYTDKPGTGTQTYTVYAQDYAGNISAASSVSVTVGSSTKGKGRNKDRK